MLLKSRAKCHMGKERLGQFYAHIFFMHNFLQGTCSNSTTSKNLSANSQKFHVFSENRLAALKMFPQSAQMKEKYTLCVLVLPGELFLYSDEVGRFNESTHIFNVKRDPFMMLRSIGTGFDLMFREFKSSSRSKWP